jgi:nucleotide-binding universal stress UspA family protein
MYKRVLLAYDGSLDGRKALREGALLAKHCGAQIYLLSVVPHSAGVLIADGVHTGASAASREGHRAVFEEALQRLQALGFAPKAKLVEGEPAQVIGAFAREVDADLVVVGHRKKGLLERWWSGDTGAYLVDYVHCSVLISRNTVSDEDFAAEFATPLALK